MALAFLTLLAQIPDPRRGQGQKWKLPPVLLATILAILSGATSYRKVHRFIETHRLRLNEAFGFGWKTAPAYSAIRFILQGLDSDMVERVFRQYGAQLNSSGRSENVNEMAVVAIDGKTLRGSFDAFNDQKAAHVLNAFAVDETLILGHLEVEEKSNEIPAVRRLIDELALEGRLITLDAMHCQKNSSNGRKSQVPSACSGQAEPARPVTHTGKHRRYASPARAA